jgi:hypothetical protein
LPIRQFKDTTKYYKSQQERSESKVDKLKIPHAKQKRTYGACNIRISPEVYDKVANVADETGRSICNVATLLLEFATERVEIVTEVREKKVADPRDN